MTIISKKLYLVVEGPFHDHGIRVDSIHDSEEKAQKRAKMLSKAYVVQHDVQGKTLSTQACVIYATTASSEYDSSIIIALYESYAQYESAGLDIQQDYQIGTFSIH